MFAQTSIGESFRDPGRDLVVSHELYLQEINNKFMISLSAIDDRLTQRRHQERERETGEGGSFSSHCTCLIVRISLIM
jgi:hypothetical protein